jgi:hypothetical protein
VRRVKVTFPDGSQMPLVAGERTVFESTAPQPPDRPPQWLQWYLLAGVSVGAVIALFGLIGRRFAIGRFGLNTLVLLWGVVGGLAGLVLAGLWGLTDHTVAYRNENLLQLNPLILGLAWLTLKGNGGSLDARRWARGLALWLAGMSVVGLVIQVLPLIDQSNGSIIAMVLPIHLGVALGLHRVRRGG